MAGGDGRFGGNEIAVGMGRIRSFNIVGIRNRFIEYGSFRRSHVCQGFQGAIRDCTRVNRTCFEDGAAE